MIVFVLLLLIVALVLLLLFRKDNINSIQKTRVLCESSNSGYFKFNDLECHYTDQGVGDAIIMIHGLGDSFRIFDELAKKLSINYRVLRIDLPAFGLSEVPRGKFDMNDLSDYYRNYVSAFVEELELNNFHLFGNSLGGWVAWDYTAHHNNKVKSLCLLASAGFEMDKVKKNITKGVLELIPKQILKKGMPFSVARLNAKETIWDSKKITKNHVLTNYNMINKKGTLDFMFEMLTGSFNPNVGEVSKVDVPTLIVWGENDKIIPVKHAAMFEKEIANSQKVIYPSCGHYPQIEYTDQLIGDWLKFTKDIN